MAHTYCNLLFHAIFSTKDRSPTISPEIRDDLLAYMGGIVRHLGGKTLICRSRASPIGTTVACCHCRHVAGRENEFVALGA